MAPKLYSIDASPPCRATLMLAKAIGLTLDVHNLDQGGEHLKPEYLKINPEHTVPTLDDGGFVIWDSHAINLYLLEKYGNIDGLYSRDLKTKALINQRLHFDSGVAFSLLLRIAYIRIEIMAPKLYSIDASPPCRATLMLAKAIGLTLDVYNLDLMGGEHLKPEYLKINPQHTVPTLDDDGFIIWDSHAINLYLLEKYGNIDALYSRDFKTKALINQRLHFDSGVAFSLLLRIAKPIRLKQTKIIPDNLKGEIRDTYGFLNSFLEGNKWTCGDRVTIADIQLAATISCIQLFEPLTDSYPNVQRWLSNCEQQPWYQPNLKGLNDFNNLFTSLINA
ncbi:glutathione s transferase d10 isoform a-related [Holotrichia oblita]|uniref:Glutathione s transferase d10 isoform a-related n=1 Tax=Holotrichia oblita TaxID=644536 RepID=A0ACB9TUZ4_HOLOL|nr:glutathione s transferase d10 isoform a-related [Holotrichia oblita]